MWPQNDCVKPLYFCSLHSSNAIAAGTTELLPIGSNKDNYISGKKVACILDSLTSELICNKEEYGEGPKNSSKNVSNDYEQKDDDVLIKERITIFPNPTHDLIHITSNSTIKMIEIFDVNGALLMNKSCTLNSTSIGTHSLSSGIYYIRIVDDLGIVTKIFCKE